MFLPVYVCKLVRESRVEYSPRKVGKINSSFAACEAAKQLGIILQDCPQEQFLIVTLDTKLKPIGVHRITTGTLDASLVHPREVFRAALLDSASSILLLHNHPSGDCTPSRQDHEVTDRLRKAGELVGVNVLDHIVVGFDDENQSFNAQSLAEHRAA